MSHGQHSDRQRHATAYLGSSRERKRGGEFVAEGIGVEFPVASARAQSIKNVAMAQMHRIGGHVFDRGARVRIVRALDGISFTLAQGDRLGLVGPNGAGKTTLIRVLAGAYTPTAGRLHVKGTPVPLTDIGTGADDESTGYENIRLRGLLLGLSKPRNRKEDQLKLPPSASSGNICTCPCAPIRRA